MADVASPAPATSVSPVEGGITAPAGFTSAALSADGKVLAVVNASALQLYDTASGDRIRSLGVINAPSSFT